MTAYHYPPGPRPIKGIGILQAVNAYYNDFMGYVENHFANHGDLVHLQFGKAHQYLVRHPDHLHQILVTDAAHYHKDNDYKNRERGLAYFLGNGLVTSDGEFWRRQRKLIAPMFHARRIEAYAETMVDFTRRMLDGWRDGECIDVDDAMMKLTLDIVAKTIFDTDVSAEADSIGAALTTLQRKFVRAIDTPNWVPTPAHLRERKALGIINDIVFRLIAERRGETDGRGDLLSMLMSARDEDGAGMTDEQVRDEAVTLILAGHETTANALNWTFYLLAQHPQVEIRLHEELDRVLGSRQPTLDDLKHLPYTEMVVKESLRLYPSVFGFSRVATQDLKLGEYDVPKGTVMGLLTWSTHRDPRWFDAPDEFHPERFTPENEATLPRYAYLPFGGGPRVCIGNSFAMMEARLVLATIAQHYRLTLAPGQVVEAEPLITLRPKGGLTMTARTRQPVPVTPGTIAEVV